MGMYSWALDGGTPLPEPAHSPRLTVPFCVPGPQAPTFSPSYGILEAREAHDWFLEMMREREQFEVETDRVGEWPMPFWSETVRPVVVESTPGCGQSSRRVASA